MFYGESMFTRSTDASKIALAYLVRHLTAQGVALIDCQQQTRHLASLGPPDRAFEVPATRARRRAAVAGLDARLAGQRRHAASARPQGTSRNPLKR